MANNDFESIYTAHKDAVWRLASKYVSSREDKEDLFQEIFVKVHRALPKFRGEAAISTWIYKIAVTTAINYVNKQKRYRWLKGMLAGLRLIDWEDPPQPMEGSVLLKPLEKLNPRQRAILLLADVEEKQLDEIAKIMGLPVGTIKSNLHRGREIIRREVGKNG